MRHSHCFDPGSGLGRPRIYQNHVLIYMGLRNTDPRIRKRPKLDQQGSNCHMRSAGRPFSEEAGPKPLHMALATLSCWNPAGGHGIREQHCSLLPCELGGAASALRVSPPLARYLTRIHTRVGARGR